MISRRGLLGLATALSLSLGFGGSALAQEVTLKLHHFLPPQANVPAMILDKWADDVEAASAGKIKVARYPAMQLGGKPPELMDQAIDGVADVVWTVVGYTPGRFPSTEVFELPFMSTDARATSRAYWEMFEKHMEDTEFADVKILGTWVHGPGMFHTDTVVERPGDMEGLKVRGGARSVNAILEAAGATPIGLPAPAIPEALSKGVVNGAAIPWEVTPALKISELVTNHTEFEGAALYTLTFVLAMNKDKYESLSDELKAAVDSVSGAEFSVFAGGTQSDMDLPARQFAEDQGNTITVVSGEALEEWKALLAPIEANWVADMQARGIDGQALIDEARMLIDKYDD